jgi:molybdopterin molybdotransferase
MSTREFFKVSRLESVLEYLRYFPQTTSETIPLVESLGRIIAEDIISDMDIPDFHRSTVDGYAVQSQATFGASDGTPALFNIIGEIDMGRPADISLKPGEAAKIPTGGMLPEGADSVVMLEHAEPVDHQTIEVYKSAVPLQHVMAIGEDFHKGECILSRGQPIRPQEMGLFAAQGKCDVAVFKKPVVAIISTGDEIVDIRKAPFTGQLRDMNAYTLTGLAHRSGGHPVHLGIAPDDLNILLHMCEKALRQADIILVSGGSSVGTRDFTLKVISDLPRSEILAHGISISPGKPTIIARIEQKAFFGLPGHVTSAMIVFMTVVHPLIEHMGGLSEKYRGKSRETSALLSRNLASVQGRTDFVRVRLVHEEGRLVAYPILGKSGLIRTMVQGDGFIEIDLHSEGLDKGSVVRVELF